MDRISCGLISKIPPLAPPLVTGIPSTTYKGSLEAEIDLRPRILTNGGWPGRPPADVMSTPATWPLIASTPLPVAIFSMLSLPILTMEPVTSLLV